MTLILLIEDSKELALLTIPELAANGYTVLHAENGLSGLELFHSRRPDLVILDWMLPKLDGLEVLRRIRQSSAALVLMLTARNEEADLVLGLEVGADDYLTKPFGMRELLARVRALLRRIENVQTLLAAEREGIDRPVSCGGLRLDPVAHQARLDDAPLDLTPTEFDLLYLLARNPGRTFSRKYLLETIWDEVYLPGNRSVDNAMLRLRKKLEPLGEVIETVWGIGYRFIPPGGTP